jgi:hypothetical protein
MTGRHASDLGRRLATLAGARVAGQSAYWAALVAAIPSVITRPHPAASLSLLFGCWAAPAGAAGVLGSLVDSWGPRTTAAVCWCSAAIAGVVPALTGDRGMPVLAAVLAWTSLSFGVGMAAGEAAPTWLPSQPSQRAVARAGAWLGAAADLSVGIGPLGAAALASVGTRAAWLLVTTLGAAAAMLSAAVPAARPREHEPAAKNEPVRRHAGTGVRGVFAVTIGVFAGYGVIQILEALYVRRVLGAPYVAYGALLAVWAAAGAVTAVAADRHHRLPAGPRAIALGAAVTAAGEALYIGTPWLAVSVAGSVVYGVGSMVFYLACRAALTAGPASQHGRILAAWWGAQAVGVAAPALVTGTLVGAVGLRAALGAAPALAALTATAAILAPRPRQRRELPKSQIGRQAVRPGMTGSTS